MATPEKQFTAETLSQCSGAEGRPACIAYKDRVIDVTGSKLWQNGQHMMRHRAGIDLTDEIKNAPHGLEVLDRYPQAGLFTAAKPRVMEARAVPPALRNFLDRFPLLKRHPHPALVHFPICFMVAAPLFTVLFLITKNTSFESTAYNCLGAGLLFSIPAMVSGLFTWWLNYMAQPLRLIIIKIILSGILFLAGLAAFIWRTLNPDIVNRLDEGVNLVYALLVLLLAPMVLAIGFCGGLLTFPMHKE
jgi:predicted heme/steroid binding protein/uncharacterized membrane protein